MNEHELIQSFEDLGIWERGDQRAPHKPITLLFALAQFQQGHSNLKYSEIYKSLEEAIKFILPHRKTIHSHYPYWYLKNDNIWNINNHETVKFRKNKKEPLKSDLINSEATAGFNNDVKSFFNSKPELISKIAQLLLDSHFPESIQEDLISLLDLNIDINSNSVKRKRNPKFRNKVMIAYDYQCAVCGYSLRLGETAIGLEAAHIKWHQAGGPDIEENGFSLCCLHHKLFDRGAFTLDENLHIEISSMLNGVNSAANNVMFNFDEKPLNLPRKEQFYPKLDYIEWHRKEVFSG